MDFKRIVEGLPSSVASLFDSIYLVNKTTNECYKINYDGSQIKVSINKGYNEIISVLTNYQDNPLTLIETNDKVSRVFTSNTGDVFITSITNENYKLIFMLKVINNVSITLEPTNEVSTKKALLVADDSPIITNFFKRIFENTYEVIVASNGDEAIKLYEANMHNIVGCFIDLQMPIKTGYDVLEYFKNNNLFAVTPVSVISGEDDGARIEELTTNYNIVDMLQKPFSQEAAINIVNKTVAQKK